MKNVFFGNWSCLNDMLRDFQINEEDIKGYRVLYAWYEFEDYSGTAFVLLKKGRKLYEVNGSHCSCMGLESQFFIEETSVEALLKRKHYGVNHSIVKQLEEMLVKRNFNK